MGGTTTIIGPQNVMALPAFMEMQLDVDFTIGRELTRGGGGSVHLGEARHEEIIQLTKDPKIVVKLVHEDPENVEETTISFEQEVSIMWLLHKEANIAKVVSVNV